VREGVLVQIKKPRVGFAKMTLRHLNRAGGSINF
jgi:hypothetical protein